MSFYIAAVLFRLFAQKKNSEQSGANIDTITIHEIPVTCARCEIQWLVSSQIQKKKLSGPPKAGRQTGEH